MGEHGMNSDHRPPLTNQHLRAMAWAAFIIAITLAVWGVASDSVVLGFLTAAASNLGLVQARNIGEEFSGKGTKSNTTRNIKVDEV